MVRCAQHRNARGLEVAQHADALLDAPPISGVAELLHDGAVQAFEGLAAMEEPSVRKAQAAGGEIDDGGLRPRGAERVRQAIGGPRARLTDDREVHATIAVARSSRRTPCRKIDRANSKSATTRPEVMNERACESVSRVSKWSSPTSRANSSANSRMSSLSRSRSAATRPSSIRLRAFDTSSTPMS